MSQVNEWLNQVSEALATLYGLPSIVLVFILCLGLGYFLKTQRWCPNDKIPLIVIAFGVGFLPLISDWRSSPLPLRIWLVRNVVVGFIVGLAAWLTHNKILKRFEDSANGKPPVVEPPAPRPPDPLREIQLREQAAAPDPSPGSPPKGSLTQTIQ